MGSRLSVSISSSTPCLWAPGEGNGNPLRYSCLENPMDRGAWWATVHARGTSGTPCRQNMGIDPSVASRRCEGAHRKWCREFWCFPRRGTTRISGSLSCGAREVRSPCAWRGPKFPDIPVSLEGNTKVHGTTSCEPLHPSCSRQKGRFPCFVCKGFPTFPANLRMRPVS